MVEVHGFRDAGLLIKIHQIALKGFIIHDAPNVALEVPVINRVEANERAKEPPIRFDDSCSEKVSARGQARLQLIERSELTSKSLSSRSYFSPCFPNFRSLSTFTTVLLSS